MQIEETVGIQLGPFLTKLRRSPFVRNVLVVMSGSAAGQAIGFALTPVISRLFTPHDFGIFGSFTSVSIIISAGATLQYNQAIVLPKENDDALNLFLASCLCALGVGLICLLVCLVAPSFMNGLMKTEGAWALALLVLGTVVTGLNQSCQAWAVRAKAFKHTSASQVIRSLTSSGSQIGLGSLKTGAAGLIVSSVLGNLLASINLVRVLVPDVLACRRSIRWGRVKAMMKEYMDFPIYSASESVVWALSVGMPVLLLSHFYGLVVAGAYAFAVRMIQTPMSLLTGSLSQVLYQKAAEKQQEGGNLTSLYLKITAGLFGLIILPAIVLFLWAPYIFAFVFGSQWHMAGEFARSLVLWMMFVFCNIPAALFAQIIRIQKILFMYTLSLLVVWSLTLIFGGLYLDAPQTIMLFSLAGGAMNIILILIVGRAIMKKEGRVIFSRSGNV